jgi:hypothetical protein
MPEKYTWVEAGEATPEEEHFPGNFATLLGSIAFLRIRLKTRVQSLEIQLLGRGAQNALDTAARMTAAHARNKAITVAIKKHTPDKLYDRYNNLKALAEVASHRAKLIINGYWIKLEPDRLALAPEHWVDSQVRQTGCFDTHPQNQPGLRGVPATFPEYTIDDFIDLQKTMNLISKELHEFTRETRSANEFVCRLQDPSSRDSMQQTKK